MDSLVRYNAYDMRHVDFQGLLLKCREHKSNKNGVLFRPVFDSMRPF